MGITKGLQVFLWCYVLVYVVVCSLQINQIDFWWQLSEGLRVLQTFSLPTQPAQAFGFPARPYFDEYAGYEVVLALFYKIGGLFILWLIFSFVYLGILILPAAQSEKKYPAFDLFSTLALLFAGLLMKERMEERPEMVGSLLQVVLMVFLLQSKLEAVTRQTLLKLFLIFLIWTNTHSSFVIGLFTLGLWIACEFILKYRTIPIQTLLSAGAKLTAVAALACVLDPYGPERLLFPFWQSNDPGSIALSPEMWPMDDYTAMSALPFNMAVILLIWAILASRRIPLWLILFSAFSLYMSTRSFRFINFLAISLLVVYSVRDSHYPRADEPLILPLRVLGDSALVFLCLFMIFADVFAFDTAYHSAAAQKHFATNANRYAPELVDSPLPGVPERTPILCGHGEGAYFSFIENKNYRPLLDSGLSHPSDVTKRYFFLFWNQPEAFLLVLKNLKVNYAVVNQKDDIHWVHSLEKSPYWEVVAASDNGLLWQRCAPGARTWSPHARAQVVEAKEHLLQGGEILSAFWYSTLLDAPEESLEILSRYNGPTWSDASFASVAGWVRDQPQETIQTFYQHRRATDYPLVDALLATRLGPSTYAKFLATNPPGPRPVYWKFLQIENALATGDHEKARQIFDTLPPHPPASSTYYTLWPQVKTGTGVSAQERLDAFGQWQVWDDDARKFVEETTAKLNDRISQPAPSN